MPLSATPEEIKAYERQLNKGQIKPDSLPPCPQCYVEAAHFKEHAYRDRKFLVIVDMLVVAVLSVLLRFRCPGCGKTFTFYPDFALPYKRYTRPTVTELSRSYVQDPEATYESAVMVDGSVPGYPDDQRTLAPSTIHRFATTVSRLATTAGTALDLVLQQNPTSTICRDLALVTVPARKYRTSARKYLLLQCFRFFVIEALFHHTFTTSIFTKLAIRCGFG